MLCGPPIAELITCCCFSGFCWLQSVGQTHCDALVLGFQQRVQDKCSTDDADREPEWEWSGIQIQFTTLHHRLRPSSSSALALYGHCQCPGTHLHRTVNCDRYLLTNCGWQQPHHRTVYCAPPPPLSHRIRHVLAFCIYRNTKLRTGLGIHSCFWCSLLKSIIILLKSKFVWNIHIFCVASLSSFCLFYYKRPSHRAKYQFKFVCLIGTYGKQSRCVFSFPTSYIR